VVPIDLCEERSKKNKKERASNIVRDLLKKYSPYMGGGRVLLWGRDRGFREVNNESFVE